MQENSLEGEFFFSLYVIDQQLAATTKAGGCECGGRLHVADYPRKPRGLPPEAEHWFATRLSFCCEREGCRQRYTPRSVRFLGRRVYVGAVVVLVAALRSADCASPDCKATEAKVPSRTVRRWQRFWQTGFIATRLWQRERSRFMPPVDEKRLPASALGRFAGELEQRLTAMLLWLSPITVQSSFGVAG
jgi:hypothetical protein